MSFDGIDTLHINLTSLLLVSVYRHGNGIEGWSMTSFILQIFTFKPQNHIIHCII